MTWQLAGTHWENSGSGTARTVSLPVAVGQAVMVAHQWLGAASGASIASSALIGVGWQNRHAADRADVALNIWTGKATGSGTLTVTVSNPASNCSLHVWTDPDTTKDWTFETATADNTAGAVTSLAVGPTGALTNDDHFALACISSNGNYGAPVAFTGSFAPVAASQAGELGHRVATAAQTTLGTTALSSTASWSSTRNVVGAIVVVTDTGGGVAPNQPPTADAGQDATTVVGETFDRTGVGTDPDGTIASYAWTLASAPSGSAATMTGAATATVTITPDIAGAYTLSLVVTDDDAAVSAADTFTLTATQPASPGAVGPVTPTVDVDIDDAAATIVLAVDIRRVDGVNLAGNSDAAQIDVAGLLVDSSAWEPGGSINATTA